MDKLNHSKLKPKVKHEASWLESNIFFAILLLIAMMLFSVVANSQTTELPPFEPAAFNEWVTLLTAGAVYLVTFLSYKIPFLNRITSTSVRYVVIALVAAVFVWAFGWTSLIGALTSVGLPSFIAVLLKQLFGLKTPGVQPKPIDTRTPEQKALDKEKKDAKMQGR